MVLLFIYVFTALGFSFLCSICEAVLLSVTPFYIESIEPRSQRAARLLKSQKESVDRPLAAILSLNTIAHTVGAAGAGAQAAIIFGSQYLGAASAVLTLLILILSEIVPKTLGAVYWRQLAPTVAFVNRGLIVLLYPLVILCEGITRLLARDQKREGTSREELKAMAEVGLQEGQIGAQESNILKNLFRFNALKAEDVMTPRTVVFALDESQTVDQVLAEHSETPFSRIPVFAGNRDRITGFVLKTEILLSQARGQPATLQELKRPISSVPQDMKLSQVLEILLRLRTHILLVMDHYGGTEGILTLEDTVETLLGLEIVDEADQQVDMQRFARDQWRKRAHERGIIPSDPGSRNDEPTGPVSAPASDPPDQPSSDPSVRRE